MVNQEGRLGAARDVGGACSRRGRSNDSRGSSYSSRSIERKKQDRKERTGKRVQVAGRCPGTGTAPRSAVGRATVTEDPSKIRGKPT
jgi:hypothetical protein